MTTGWYSDARPRRIRLLSVALFTVVSLPVATLAQHGVEDHEDRQYPAAMVTCSYLWVIPGPLHSVDSGIVVEPRHEIGPGVVEHPRHRTDRMSPLEVTGQAPEGWNVEVCHDPLPPEPLDGQEQ